MAAALKQVWLAKVRATLGREASDDKEVTILNRVVRWCDDGFLYKADPRHVEKLLRQSGLENCKSLNTPGAKDPPRATSTAWFESEDLPEKGPLGCGLWRGTPCGSCIGGGPSFG